MQHNHSIISTLKQQHKWFAPQCKYNVDLGVRQGRFLLYELVQECYCNWDV